MKRIAVCTIVLTLALCVVLAPTARVLAAEGGVGHYAPGTVATFIDEAPPKETPFALMNQFYFYDGSVEPRQAAAFGRPSCRKHQCHDVRRGTHLCLPFSALAAGWQLRLRDLHSLCLAGCHRRREPRENQAGGWQGGREDRHQE